MKFIKIFRLKTSAKPKIGYNSLWLIRCSHCGELMFEWDTNIYNRVCPICQDSSIQNKRSDEEIKNNIFRIQRRLYDEYKTSNILSAKEVGLLSHFRDTKFESVLRNLMSDYWFGTREYTKHRKTEWKISKRGEQLIKNSDFIDLLSECYNLLHNGKEEI